MLRLWCTAGRRLLPLAILLCLLAPAQELLADEPAQTTAQTTTVQAAYFSDTVLPILRESCFECHSHEFGEASGQLMLDSLAAMTSGGTRGNVVVQGKPQESLLLKAVEYEDDDLQMPPSGRLPAEAVAAIRKWIADGAHVPEAMRGSDPNTSSNDAHSAYDMATQSHWAYQPLAKPSPTDAVADSHESESPKSNTMDAILLAKLREQGLEFSPRADRTTLARRLYYDLIGLPPTIEQLTAFKQDSRPDAVATQELVDQLLASTKFGERWARYWMDIARYADNKGYVFQEDREYPEAYRYRDWLISAFNSDMPYDEFVRQQIAADLLLESMPAAESHGNLPALGFLTLGRRFLNNKFDIIDDRLDVVSRGLMGMTLTCARCHDHKYDPISQADYYAMSGVFLNTEEPGGEPWPHRLQDTEKRQQSFVLIRGSPGSRGDKVANRFVSFLAPENAPFEGGSGRLELANKIVATDNPLTPRVLANRIWLRLMGASLAESPSDFGTRCPPPVLLPLLDHLASELVSGGWSMKSLIRRIVLSEAYSQQSVERELAAKVDPNNDLYWKVNRRRLDFEALRDTLLVRSGQMDMAIHGKSETIHTAPFSKRRTVYAYIDRQNLPNLFRTFDLASPDAHSPRRAQTSVPQQGLYLLNSEFMAQLSMSLASRVEQVVQESGVDAGLSVAFSEVLGRLPTRDELSAFRDFLATQPDADEPLQTERWIYGWGQFTPEQPTLTEFQRLPHFTGDAWQGGGTLPDNVLGWCMLRGDGGHPGNDLQHAAVRRWIAPRDGQVNIEGRLKHPDEKGDGVRGSVFADSKLAGQWTVHNSTKRTKLSKIAVRAGEPIDFVTDCVAGPSFDGFQWKMMVTYADDQGSGQRETFDSLAEFSGPPQPRLSPWAQAIQVLLSSNELAFVD